MQNVGQHLKKYIADSGTRPYTPRDQAVWRYTLRQLKNFLSEHAHPFYVEGLSKTGITIEEIPSISSISQKLSQFGWTAQPVSGFIPPAIFMEMQAAHILPIARDMRSVDQIQYTPAPDIVHEAAGHAPMLAHPEYADYLKAYAQVAKKAIISHEDLAIYNAIRKLSDLKSQNNADEKEIEATQKHLEQISKNMKHLSEATLLSRMNWWTAEYGLIGTLENPKIFGAGLLSSVGEAKWCLSSKVKKIPLTVDCINYTYDITEPQPQLFVTPDFKHLSKVLNDFSEQMAYKTGGVEGLKKALASETVCTLVLKSGLQISGQVVEYLCDDRGQVAFVKTKGPTQLCLHDQQLPEHSKDYHSQGYSTPIGILKNLPSLKEKTSVTFEYTSGAKVSGLFKSALKEKGQIVLVTLEKATVEFQGRTLFQPDWGNFDLAMSEEILSVFGGPADRLAYGDVDDFAVATLPTPQYSEKDYKIFGLYQTLRDLRHGKKTPFDLQTCLEFAKTEAPKEWLLFLEILELSRSMGQKNWEQVALEHLKNLNVSDEVKACIEDGITLSSKMRI